MNLGCGICWVARHAFSKLSLLLLFRFLHVPAVLGFYVSITGILFCIAGFGGIFLVILALNLTRVRMNNPIELLRGGNTGEKEPRAKWLMALLGMISLGVGYYLAVTTESPIQAIFIFLLAVILVMAGTYLLFTAGSIVILKLLRKNKKFYYKTGNFISVSGMIYRMKQNAAGLASICILSTGVLLLLSMTVSLYFGMGDIMVNRYPFDTDARISGISQEQSEQIQKVFAQAIKNDQVPAEKTVDETYLEIGCRQEKNGIMIGQAYSYSEDGKSVDLYTIRQSEYEKLTGEKTDLHDGEIFAWYPSEKEKDILDNLELRSENVQDILTQPPHWMIRWGNTVIFVILLMVLLMSYVIKYPEFIPAPIVVTSKNPPEKLEARTNSKR